MNNLNPEIIYMGIFLLGMSFLAAAIAFMYLSTKISLSKKNKSRE